MSSALTLSGLHHRGNLMTCSFILLLAGIWLFLGLASSKNSYLRDLISIKTFSYVFNSLIFLTSILYLTLVSKENASKGM